MSKNNNSRAIVAKVLCALLSDQGSLTTQLNNYREHPEFGLIQESCYGCCRWFFALEALLNELLNKPLKKQDLDIKCLMLCALYQLRELEVAEYAVINEAVSAVTAFKKPWAKGLVNAVLRGYQRRRDELEGDLTNGPALAFPDWLQAEIRQQWPQDAETILANSNKRPPMTLRVNLARGSRRQYLDRLQAGGHDATEGELTNSALYLHRPAPVTELPGFDDGQASVQDEASQIVPGLLRLEPRLRVLDACAAPGGKTCHLLESEHSLTSLVAIDRSQSKLDRIQANLDRLQLQAELRCADAGDVSAWWDGKPFDRILLDAPCSATGVIRRHPDVKVLRTASQVEELTRVQARLLAELWPCLQAGGLLLYTTCSLLRQENEGVIARFLESTPDAKHEAITADWGVECAFGRQLLPGTSLGPDGFFYSVLKKETA